MTPTLPILALGLALCLPAHAALQQPLQLAAGNNNPYNSPIQRANPNSRQGSMPATPPVRGPSTDPYQRPPHAGQPRHRQRRQPAPPAANPEPGTHPATARQSACAISPIERNPACFEHPG